MSTAARKARKRAGSQFQHVERQRTEETPLPRSPLKIRPPMLSIRQQRRRDRLDSGRTVTPDPPNLGLPGQIVSGVGEYIRAANEEMRPTNPVKPADDAWSTNR